MTEASKKINSREDAVRFFDYLIKVENANFHPDDDFCNYVSLGTNEKSFSPEKCALLNQRMDECFTVLGDKIYDVAQACVNKHYPLLKQKQSGGSVNGKPKLMFANGGPMDAGGFGSQRSFTIAELKAYLEKEFPYSLGFKLYPYKPNARTLEPDLSNYEGLTDAEIKDKLLFGSIGKWHSVNIEMQQGQENTYFYFALETESNKESYIGSFGFKDRGDVPLWYARKFINFLMDAYDMPKEEITKLSERMATVSELKELAELHQPIGRPFPNRLRYSGYETGGPLKNLYAVGVYKGHLKYGQNNEIAEDVYEAKIKGNKDAVKKIELAMMDRFLFSDIPHRIGAIVPVKVTKAKFDIPLSVANYIHSCANYAVHPPQKMPVVINPTRATIQNKDVLVVDDVVYSGATLKKYEDMLKKLGARTISFLVYGKSAEQNEQKAVGGETGSTFHEKAIARIKPEERALVVNSIDSRSIQQMVESYIPPINYHNRKNEPFRFTVECGFIYSSLELQSLTENFKSYGYSMGYTSLIYSVAYEESAGQYNANLHDDKTIESNKRQLNEIQLTWGHGNVESAKWSEGYSMGSRTLHVKLKGKSKAVDYQLPENLFINTGSKVDTELGDKEKKVIGEYLISHYKKMNDMDHPLTFKVRKYNFLDIN